MKNGKLFAKIVYYLFTFTIGILLAIFLPYIYMSDGETLNMMEESLDKGKYADAMLLVGGYFEDREVFSQKFENGGGIVLFNAVTLVYTDGTDEDEVSEATVHKAYGGFVYGVKKSYNITATLNNKTKMLVVDGDGKEHTVTILDTDANGDKTPDTIGTYDTNGFFFIELDADTFPSVRKLTLIDREGKVFEEVGLELDFKEQFFDDATAFVEEYNRDYKSDKLNALNDEFLAKSEHYKISSLGVARSKADTKAAIVVVVYFVSVYVIADFLLGKRYILKFFNWFLFKVCKIKRKKKTPDKKSPVYGNDYYCQATMVLDTSAVEGFSESVQIRYTSEKGEEISFILLKQEKYTVTQRLKAGIYVNMWIDIDKNEYVTEDLPETLAVEGYRKTFKIKILRREEKRDENFNSTSD